MDSHRSTSSEDELSSQGDSSDEESSHSDEESSHSDGTSRGDSGDESSVENAKRKKTKAAKKTKVSKKTKASKKSKAAKSHKRATNHEEEDEPNTRAVQVVSSKGSRQRLHKKQRQDTDDEDALETQEQVDARVQQNSARLSSILFDPNLLRVNKKLVTTRRKEYYTHNKRKHDGYHSA